jgi:hypothetical protein
MKRLLVIAVFGSVLISGYAQNIPPSPPDKSVVYFVRTSGAGALINFSYFDSTKLIGRFKSDKYIRYECRPGKHLFWARAENRDFIEADLMPGKVYVIRANPRMGFGSAHVNLEQIDPNDPKEMKGILKLMAKKPSQQFTAAELAEDTKDLESAIQHGMEKYAKDKASGETITQLNQSLFYKTL